MGEVVQADLDNLHQLGGVLAAHAGVIGQLKITAAVAMPGSPVQDAATQASAAVTRAYGFLAGNVRQMSDSAHATTNSYDAFDQAFSGQLRRYETGG